MSSSRPASSLDELVWRVGPMRAKLARYADHSSLANLTSTSTSARDALRPHLAEANRRLLTRIVGKETADAYYKMVDIETRDDGVVCIYTSKITDDDETGEIPHRGYWILRTAAMRNGCIPIVGRRRLVIPGIHSEYTFFLSLASGKVTGKLKTDHLTAFRYTYRQNDDPTQIMEAFPESIWNRSPWRKNDTDMNIHRYHMEPELSVFENVLKRDMADLPYLSTEEIDDRMRTGIVRDMRATEFPPETLEGGALNPEFTKAYSDRMYAAITEHAGGAFDAVDGTRVFATWAEAMNFKWSNQEEDIVIEFVE
jgi:hypothetical protein